MRKRRQIFDFLASRDARRGCPLCGKEAWNGWDDRAHLPTLDDEGRPVAAIEVIPLVCAHCGFVRLQSAHVLDDPRD